MTAADPCIMAIDLGTSGPKVALFTSHGEALDCEFEPNPVLLSEGGGAEQRPDDWWDAIKKAAGRLMARGAAAPERIAALCCTTQWSGTVAVGADGKPLMNAIIWLDSRGAPDIAKLVGGAPSYEGYNLLKLRKWISVTGGVPGKSGKDPIAHILYLRRAHPEIYAKTHKFLEVKDYLNLRLTGQFAASYDSIALHWVTDNRDLKKVDYDAGLLALATLEREKLPDLKRAVDILGPILPAAAADLGLRPGVQVIMGTPDVPSAAVGSGAVRDYEGHLYIGTSAWLVCHVPFKKTDVLHNMTSLPSAIPERYFVANEQETAGGCMNFLRDNLFFPDDELAPAQKPEGIYKAFDRMAAKAPAGSGRVIFTPWLWGERTPVEDHSARGGFHNLSLQTTRSHMVRAVFEGVAYNARWLLQAVEGYIRRPFPWLNMIGGGANSDLWCQIVADVFNRPIRQVKDPIQANARGAAFLAACAMGYMTFDQIGERTRIVREYPPDARNRAIYDELFAEFVNLYKRNKAIHARLNRKH